MALQGTHDALVDQAVANDGWFPDLNVSELQELFRVPAEIAPVTMVQQINLALAEVNLALADWKEDQVTAGLGALTDQQVPIYKEAVYSRAYSWLVPMLVTLYFTSQSDELEDEKQTRRGDFVLRSDEAINLLRRTTDPCVGARGGDVSVDLI